ncbi:CDP-glycerol glycerophosphotransferase family protein [Siminovitchia acidinfaciens]|uniref:CDP-glycerol glycerophosphotransferase family protein n=1 Tax=Siminovitchia acidinfaciens TaxID=2321395 RepID=A0A429XZK1_9BACI|nr:CDP-glycerol glycerophosphotransferase family protein [Siminovitchia acidinfaciens]RST74213.1 CDP-glycerol glycerophosphotransferase family protein [Siminovitchia acidinfaciens]
MIKSKLRNNEMTNIYLNDKTYTVELSVKKSYIDGWDDYYFSMKQRDGVDEILLPFNVNTNEAEEFIIVKLSLSTNDYPKLFLEKKIWDVYINRKKDVEVVQSRIKSTNDYLRFYSIVLPDQNKMFYPFTTKNRRLSFFCNDYCLFANVEEVKNSGKEIAFSGHFNYPPLFNENGFTVKKIQMVLTNNINENINVVPLEVVERTDLFDKFNGNKLLKSAGFRGKLNINTEVDLERKLFHKFFLRMTYEKDGKVESIQSNRVRWIQDRIETQKKIVRSVRGKIKILVKPTKKSKFLSLQISNYNFKEEFIHNAKRKWVEFRRGKFVQNMYRRAFHLLGKIPAKKNLIIFESFHGKQYSDSPRAIYEFIRDNNYEYEMYWSADRRHVPYFEQLDRVKYLRRFSIKWLLMMARAKYWVTNARLPLWLPKPKETIYLQTWHGTPLKRLAADMEEVHMPGTNTEKYKKNFLYEASKWDYLVSPNAYSTEIFKRAFGFEKTIVESGYPRNDFLINNNNEKTIRDLKETCNLPIDKKIILYAPTWRDNQFYAKGKYKFNLQLDLDRLKSEFGHDHIIVLRLHYLVAENLDLTGYEGFVFDLSKHDDIRELYLISDIMITDYSSVFFDYANLKRPMIFFVYDIEEYRDNLRGFYFDFEAKAPGPLVKTTEELINEIKTIDEFGFARTKNIEEFYSRFCYLEDGRASDRVVKEVFGK